MRKRHPQHEETLNFALFAVCHLHRIRAQQLLEALGLYQGQPPLLRELWDQEGQTQSELAARLNIKQATLTKMLQRMEKSGFIQRKDDPTDQRRSRVYLTPAGWAVQEQVEAVWATLEQETFVNLNQEERLLLRRLLLQMRQNLQQASGEDLFKED